MGGEKNPKKKQYDIELIGNTQKAIRAHKDLKMAACCFRCRSVMGEFKTHSK